MRKAATVIAIAFCLLCVREPLYAQTALIYPGENPALIPQEDAGPEKNIQLQEITPKEPLQPAAKPAYDTKESKRVFNALYNKHKIDEKEAIRSEWKKAFGVDVWYPYYKAKEVEDWVRERFSVKVFGIKGKPKFEDNQIRYVFKTTF